MTDDLWLSVAQAAKFLFKGKPKRAERWINRAWREGRLQLRGAPVDGSGEPVPIPRYAAFERGEQATPGWIDCAGAVLLDGAFETHRHVETTWLDAQRLAQCSVNKRAAALESRSVSLRSSADYGREGGIKSGVARRNSRWREWAADKVSQLLADEPELTGADLLREIKAGWAAEDFKKPKDSALRKHLVTLNDARRRK
jgi:hypothetical protein